MPKCTIDGGEYEFKPGETLIEIADRNGISIPRFCYHPSLTVVAQCRMCAVEIEKMPKLQTACSTPAAAGMTVKTRSDKVSQMRSSVMEFLLINHPLDCPICDKSGECDLQNYSYDYGAPDSRYEEQRRTFLDPDMGSVIKKNMNRCIHCTRCIRFCDEVGGSREMVALKRGNNTEITTADGKPLKTKYAGNLADICPTGALSLKDFRFQKRVWYLKKTKSVCEGCSQGCNVEFHHENNEIFRTLPRENKDINKWWICDEGRFLFHTVHSETRIVDPLIKSPKKPGQFDQTDWTTALCEARTKVDGKVLVLIGSDLTLEEMKLLMVFSKKNFQGSELFHFGTQGHLVSSDDRDEDGILRRTSKTSNLHGAEKLGLKGFDGQGIYDSVVIARGGRAFVPPNFKKVVKGTFVGIGVFTKNEITDFEIVLPGLSFAEKSGTIVNWQGKEQKIQKAIEPLGQSKSLSELFRLWS